ncbi:sensor histidine kinase [Algoriphagus sp.]|uniref:sensor histidine kinase n=1 Tax=Algoriphagus sp. TaxID=1872435 RepID=UPI00391B3C4E
MKKFAGISPAVYLFFSTLFFFEIDSFSQSDQFFIRSIAIQEGLPTKTVYDLAVSSKGHLYLGTNSGIFRYNGKTFRKIQSDASIDTNFDNIIEDESGKIWCKNLANQVFFIKNDTLRLVPALQESLSKTGNLRQFAIHRQKLYLASGNSFFSFDPESDQTVFIESSDASLGLFLSVFEDKDSSLYYFKRGKVKDIERGGIAPADPSWLFSEGAILSNELFALDRTLNGKIYSLSNQKQIETPAIPANTNLYFPRVAGEELWICSSSGLFRYSKETKQVDQVILNGVRASDVVEDFSGNIWISTLDHGLKMIASENISFTDANENNFPNTKFLSLFKDEILGVFAGTNSGKVLWMDTNGSLVREFDSKNNSEVLFVFPDVKNSRVFYSQGYFDLEGKNHPNYFGRGITLDDSNNYLIANNFLHGLFSQSLKDTASISFGGRFNVVPFSQHNFPLLRISERAGRAVHFSKFHQLYYFATVDGLMIYDQEGEHSQLLSKDGNPILVNSMREDSQGNLWIGTQQNGLLKVNGRELVEQYRSESGLESNLVRKVLVRDNLIWMITDVGIFTLDSKTGKASRNQVSDYFRTILVYDLIQNGNEIWFGTSQGILKYAPDKELNIPSPILELEKTTANGELWQGKLQFPHQVRNLVFDFEVIHLSGMGGQELEYILSGNGGKNDWISVQSPDFQISFPALSPGNYSLKVRANVNQSISEVIEIPFKVDGPFWLSWWFFILTILFFGVLVFVYLEKYKRRLRRRQVFREKLLSSQLTALQSQMNPHFLFNVLNAVQGYIYSNQKASAADYLGKFSQLLRKTLDQSDRQFLTLEEELSLIRLYVELELVRFEDGFEFLLDLEDNIDIREIKIPSLIIQPFVENAIKHGLLHQNGAKCLSIKIATKPNHDSLLIVIEDNGIGREASKEINSKRIGHQSFAIKSIDSRMELLRELFGKEITYSILDLIDQSGKPSGTLVSLTLPNLHE